VETLLEDTTAVDPEWPKLAAVPGLLEPWHEVKDRWQVATEEFKVGPSGDASCTVAQRSFSGIAFMPGLEVGVSAQGKQGVRGLLLAAAACQGSSAPPPWGCCQQNRVES
jgi:hypothetical protein